MKLRLTIDIELPDNCAEWSDAELRQVVFDAYINYNTCSHLQDAMKWLVESGKREDATTAKIIQKHHNDWADISSAAVWSMERLASEEKV